VATMCLTQPPVPGFHRRVPLGPQLAPARATDPTRILRDARASRARPARGDEPRGPGRKAWSSVATVEACGPARRRGPVRARSRSMRTLTRGRGGEIPGQPVADVHHRRSAERRSCSRAQARANPQLPADRLRTEETSARPVRARGRGPAIYGSPTSRPARSRRCTPGRERKRGRRRRDRRRSPAPRRARPRGRPGSRRRSGSSARRTRRGSRSDAPPSPRGRRARARPPCGRSGPGEHRARSGPPGSSGRRTLPGGPGCSAAPRRRASGSRTGPRVARGTRASGGSRLRSRPRRACQA
jgi:hypothetical protein